MIASRFCVINFSTKIAGKGDLYPRKVYIEIFTHGHVHFQFSADHKYEVSWNGKLIFSLNPLSGCSLYMLYTCVFYGSSIILFSRLLPVAPLHSFTASPSYLPLATRLFFLAPLQPIVLQNE
jgi:hypothetical protein